MEQLKLKNIVFCFPYKGVGGVSVLFLRISDYLQKTTGRKIYLVDYADGYMARHNKNSQVELIVYSDVKKVEIPKNSVVILQTMTPWSIFPQLSFPDESGLFFWNCHPFNLVPLLPGLRNWIARYPKFILLSHKTILIPYNNLLKRFYSFLTETKAIAFMDIDNLKMTEYILGPYSKEMSFLPIPVDVPTERKWLQNKSPSMNQKLRCGWIGRIADFKYTVLKRSITELQRFSEEQKTPIHFILIGDGDYAHEVTSGLRSSQFFTFEWIKEISTHQLDEYILNNIDLLFSMGTSALEAAKLGIPTVLLDFSYGPVNENYKFKFLYETQGYSLGALITPAHCNEKKSIDGILQKTLSQPNMISNNCYKYVRENHNLNKIGEIFLNKIDNSSLIYGNLVQKGFLKKNIIYRFFKFVKNALLRN